MSCIENHGLISVIIPIYNVEPYLQRCLDSIYRNTYKNLEIICVNDGSTDNSLEILKSQQDKRIIIIDKKNGGVSSARNAGLKVATGEYIAFVDPDDWVHSRYFELLHSSILGCEMSVCGYQKVSSWSEEQVVDQVEVHTISNLNGSVYNLLSNCVAVWGRLYRRAIINGFSFRENIAVIEDKIFNIEVFAKINRASVISAQLYYYYNRMDSLVHTNINVPVEAIREVFFISKKIKSAPVLRQTYRMIFACRYLNMFQKDAKEISQEANKMLAVCRIDAKSLLTLKERLLYNLLGRFPILYRLWRISGDPTLLNWERSEKEQRDRDCR